MDAVTARVDVPGWPSRSRRDVHERLLVASLDEGQVRGVLVERLPEPGDVAVAEDAQGRRDEPTTLAVDDAVLLGQVQHERLGGGQPHGCGVVMVVLLGVVGVTTAGRGG